MPSDFPGSPRLLKGALVVFEASARCRRTSSPSSTTRTRSRATFQQQHAAGRGAVPNAGDTMRVLPPTESFRMASSSTRPTSSKSVNPIAVATGLHPTLAALELLSTRRRRPDPRQGAREARLRARVAASAPIVLLVWGPLRVVPVRVESVAITEQAFDQLLNPIRAKVELALRTLTARGAQDAAGPPFDTLAIVNQIAKEVLARTAPVASVDADRRVAEALLMFAREADTSASRPRSSSTVTGSSARTSCSRTFPPAAPTQQQYEFADARAARPDRLRASSATRSSSGGSATRTRRSSPTSLEVAGRRLRIPVVVR